MMEASVQQKMIRELDVRGRAPETKAAYIRALDLFLNHFKCSDPEQLGLEEIKEYQHYMLVERGYAPRTVNRETCGIRFFYTHVMKQWWMAEEVIRVKAPSIIPVILSEDEVARMIERTENIFYKAMLMVLYSTGMRQGELRELKTSHIDSKRMVINIHQGKGGKDRQAFLSPLALRTLRMYWRVYRLRLNQVKSDWLFIPNKNCYNGVLKKKLSHTALGYVINVATKAAGIKKNVTPHTLRHSFAVHLLERGVDTRHIQYLLGHASIRTTVKYLHIANMRKIPVKSPLDGLFEGVKK